MTHLPTVFISYGASDIPVKSAAVQNFLRQFPPFIPQPNPSYNVKAPLWVTKFDEWLAQAIAQNDVKSLLNYRQLAPCALDNHLTDDTYCRYLWL
ncbi:hypothetical protein NIES21_17330 [Anabaenopsis circularis NIES-21]|uniref:Uncharacterized protein n=1 Tax=Anabaenopsis circularis NIES-21 TaxID=1085406 RepID=A0A1Z4GEI8_9CYAN|nr:hypothetical protein NIES21_17330 [Anabaenopsis circularis NIES-21]